VIASEKTELIRNTAAPQFADFLS